MSQTTPRRFLLHENDAGDVIRLETGIDYPDEKHRILLDALDQIEELDHR